MPWPKAKPYQSTRKHAIAGSNPRRVLRVGKLLVVPGRVATAIGRGRAFSIASSELEMEVGWCPATLCLVRGCATRSEDSGRRREDSEEHFELVVGATARCGCRHVRRNMGRAGLCRPLKSQIRTMCWPHPSGLCSIQPSSDLAVYKLTSTLLRKNT